MYIHFVTPSGKRLKVEQAQDQIKGLMFRSSMPKSQGMFFSYEGPPKRRAMWMKNMLFPLDIVWLNANLEIVHINRDVPPCDQRTCPSYSSIYKVAYAIELNAGTATRLSLNIGDTLRVYKAPTI